MKILHFLLFIFMAGLMGEAQPLFSATSPQETSPSSLNLTGMISASPLALFQIQTNPFNPGSRPELAPPKPRQNRFTQWLIKVQREIRTLLHTYIRQIREGSMGSLLLSIGVCLLYGVIHAAGPGHRKIVLFGYFSAHPSRFSTLVLASFASSAIHALSAVLLTVIVYYSVQRAASTEVDKISSLTEIATWLFIALFGFILFINSIVGLCKKLKALDSVKTKNSGGLLKSAVTLKREKWGLRFLVFITSIVPCPAASMIMLITLQQEIAWLGVLLIVAMSLGMGVTITLAAAPALFSNWGILRISRRHGKKSGIFAQWGLEMTGALIMVLFGLLMSVPILIAL